ncbi:cupin fold metalloprotein, WbuC family [Marinifilum sp. N1E240]|uniref:WbuC family cupin fold metalloprotein n=1 Tax=Marinifilum sp. N1E240 TaxID=2608082 RepID=UPI001417C4F6|nr:WbuC family cupin fold metalloprotein [uncultured Marinifilum sp.]MPQ46467.1 cupin fold metalloprotein, WbuC family [Marinifilum sp. N1E240]
MKYINSDLLDQVSKKAIENSRKRMNYNFHANGEEVLQRMLNAIEPDTYLPPHRHPEKVEIFLLLRGKVKTLFFNDIGEITEVRELNPINGEYGVEIPAGIWHTILVEESGSVIYELKEGPYVPGVGVEFASWAPEPKNEEECRLYREKLSAQISKMY